MDGEKVVNGRFSHSPFLSVAGRGRACVCSITGVACEYRAYLEILSSLLSLSLSDIHPQRANCDLHDAFTDETMATRLRVLNRWALQV